MRGSRKKLGQCCPAASALREAMRAPPALQPRHLQTTAQGHTPRSSASLLTCELPALQDLVSPSPAHRHLHLLRFAGQLQVLAQTPPPQAAFPQNCHKGCPDHITANLSVWHPSPSGSLVTSLPLPHAHVYTHRCQLQHGIAVCIFPSLVCPTSQGLAFRR